MDGVRTYAQRRLSPFKGTVQVVEVDDGRALSYDGWLWNIQLRSQTPIQQMQWGDIGPRRASKPFFNYGSWMPPGDLRRLPLNPILGDVSEYPALAALRTALAARPSVPFPLQDRCECWLVDRAGMPVTLFASQCDETQRNLPQHPRWQATSTDDPDFVSATLQQDNSVHGPHAAWLTDAVKRRTGLPLRLQWFRRESDGRGLALDGRNLLAEWEGRTLAADAFPALLMREVWRDAQTAAAVQDYLAWQAPYLLTLPNLAESRRRELEAFACRRPAVLMQQLRLLPHILDREAIDAALVRARLENG